MESGKLLVVADDLASSSALSTSLANRGYAVDVAAAANEAIEKIRKDHYDLVLLDPALPDDSGADLLALLRGTSSRAELPVILVTDAEEGRAAEQVQNRGANDFITKPVAFPVAAARIETHLSLAHAERQARYRDALTGLDNRACLMERLEAALARDGHVTELLVVNLDGFKLLNTSFGQRAGDQLLAFAADRLRTEIPRTHVARIGGDEFAVLREASFRTEQPNAGLKDLAAQAIRCFERPFALGEIPVAMTASIGGTLSSGHKTTADELWREADLAMWRAKEFGKNRFELFNIAQREDTQARANIGMDLRRALENKELVAYYQPKVDLSTGVVVGFEALLRWQHPTRGMVPPVDFIPVAEELGLIVPIGEWILGEACRQLKRWQQLSPCTSQLSMNVNLSVKQLHDPLLVSRVETILEETSLSANALKFELTESALMTEIDTAKSTLSQLRALGVGLKLDDFGTGYSSLNYLRTLHFDSLKIDRSFIAKIARDRETEAIVATIINLAHILRMQVVAEGIETEEQFQMLKRMGCDIGQGYFFSKPVPASDAERFLRQHFASEDAKGAKPVARLEPHHCRSVA